MIKVDAKLNKGLIFNYKFTINRGDFVALVGKSGSGKSTLLRILAGLEDAKGEIEVFGTKWLSNKFKLPPQKREIGFVFQDYALFENMSVEQNLLYVKKDKPLADKLLNLSELEHLKDKYPKHLSGGQKQRVALCRALMKRPKILLLDEPLSALDSTMRKKLQEEILKVHKEFNLTTIMVSHDKAEIYKLANRVLKLSNGKVINNSPIDYSNVSKELILEAEVIKVLGDIAIVSIYNNLLKIKLKNAKVGDIIKLKASDFLINKDIII